MVEAVVEFDYAAQEPDELTIHKGDVITEINMQPGGWWEGKLKGKRGMFPDNFVKVISGERDVIPEREGVSYRTKNGNRKCKVLYSYHPVNEDELALQVDDIIEILDEVEDGWWKGKLRNQTGVFPSNFVVEINDENPQPSQVADITGSITKGNPDDLVKTSDSSVYHNNEETIQSITLSTTPSTDSELPVLPPKPVKEICKVLYPYKALNDDELTLREGDIITLISRDGQDKGWWKGELHGEIGFFPDNFVQLVPVDEVSKPTRPPTKATSVTTSRGRGDSITKPTNISGSPPSSLTSKKNLETPPKTDEKTSPPGIGKKPNLPPPPLKKPQRSPSNLSSKPIISSPTAPSEITSIKHEIPGPVSGPRSPSLSPGAQKQPSFPRETSPLQLGKPMPGTRKLEPDVIDGSCLSNPCTNTASYTVINHDENHSTSNYIDKSEIDFDCVGRTAMLTHPTASRPRAPHRRPPSGISAKDESSGTGVNTGGLMNGNVESHMESKGPRGANKNALLEELKMSQTKKQLSQGKTRVMIGPGSAGGGESTPDPTSPLTAVNNKQPTTVMPVLTSPVVFRNSNNINSPFGQRPQSMFSGEKTSPNTRPFSVIGTSSENITLSVKQWNEINDKVSRLEATVESQQEFFMKAIKELTSKLNEETERVLQMQLEIEKLTDLVTQV